MKIRVGGGVGGAVGKALGVIGILAPAPKVYEILSRGVADGIFMPMETKKSFKLKEVVRTPDTFVMVTELVRGGELFNKIVEMTKFTEAVCRDIMFQLLEAVEVRRHGVDGCVRCVANFVLRPGRCCGMCPMVSASCFPHPAVDDRLLVVPC